MYLSIDLEEFKDRTGLNPSQSTKAQRIVSLRDISLGTITSVQVMPAAYLHALLRNVTLEGDPNVKPYAKCDIIRVRIDPNNLYIGQTFVQRSKYQNLLEGFGFLLDDTFCVTKGTAKCGALIVFGKDNEGQDVVAHYVPPIIEISEGHQFLLDGIHRNFLVMRVGTTIESILIKGVEVPLPCDMGPWRNIRIVDEKPPRPERFSNLQPKFFRNLKHIGIDG